MGAHGIMFHHFHNDDHPKGQGSICADDFSNILFEIGLDKILPAEEWLGRAINNKLSPKDVCLTFDDALKCQFDIALPVLSELNLTAFWFVYSSIFHGEIERLELYRFFRTTCFTDELEFYEEFNRALKLSPFKEDVRIALKKFIPENYLTEYLFYSNDDRQFRFLRDEVLGPKRYFSIMDNMIEQRHDFNTGNVHESLWMNNKCLKSLQGSGHVIGLHSYSHPTRIDRLSKQEQETEYKKNADHLESVLENKPSVMAHPCGAYNDVTLGVLKELNIRVGFCSSMAKATNSLMEFPREDHANIMSRMRNVT